LVIKASSAREIDSLVADLSSDRAVIRDGAIARLTVIGSRAVDRLAGLAADPRASAVARIAAFRTLAAIAEPRALRPALGALTDADSSVVVAALHTARAFLRTPRGVEALDRVIEIALDRRRPVAVRIAAIHALTDLPEATVKPVLTALSADPDVEIANALQPARRRATVNTTQRLEDAAVGTLPSDAAVLKSAIARSAADVPLSTLRQVIEHVRVHEGSEPAERRTSWMATRAAAHLALAHRGSRLALYDLRETIESARERIPVEFFAAVAEIGDATCLEPVAHAYARAKDDWSRRHLADAFRAIVSREKLTTRHAAVKKVEKRWPGTWTSLVASPVD
jgi:HEAT repeat protein